MAKKKKTSAGRPANAVASDAQSIINKATWELDKFNAKVANNMGKILEEYYALAFTAEKENTRLAVLKELIKMQKEMAETVDEVSDLEKPRTQEGDDDEDEDEVDMGNILSVDFDDRKQG